MSQLPLPSQQMPAREPALDRQEDLDDRADDCVEIEPPRLGVPMKQKQQRAAALEKDPLFGETWTGHKARGRATLAVAQHSTAQERRSSPPLPPFSSSSATLVVDSTVPGLVSPLDASSIVYSVVIDPLHSREPRGLREPREHR